MRTKLLLILWSFGFGMFASLLILLYEIARYNYSPNMWIQFMFIGLLIGCIFLLFNLKEIRSNKLLLILLMASLVVIAGCNKGLREITEADNINEIEMENKQQYIKDNCNKYINVTKEYEECSRYIECSISDGETRPIGFGRAGYFWIYEKSIDKTYGLGKYQPPAFYNVGLLSDVKLCEDMLCRNIIYQVGHGEILAKCYEQNLVKSELGLIASREFNYLCRQNFLDYSCEELRVCAIWNEDASRYLQTMNLKGCELE